MFKALEKAGYSLDNPEELKRAIVAYNCAALISFGREPQAIGAGLRSAKTGRNDPCPCGSGNKYKKCCLNKSHDAPRSRPEPGDREVAPEVIPNLYDLDSFKEDLAVFAGLLESDDDLRTIRFSRERAAAYFSDELARQRETHDDLASEFMDEVAFRYVERFEKKDWAKDIPDKLINASSRVNGTDERRALAAGLVCCAASLEARDSRDDVLACVIFRLSVAEYLRLQSGLSDALEAVLGPGGLSSRDTVVESISENDMKQVLDKAGPELANLLERTADERLKEVREAIKDGRFPAALPVVTLLPMLIGLDQLRLKKRKPTLEEFKALVDETLECWDPEDTRLVATALDDWLRKDETRDDHISMIVRMVRSFAARQTLVPLDFTLLIAALRYGKFAELEGEPEMIDAKDGAAFTPEYLELYGDYLVGKGLNALARRTYRLCETPGPLPASVVRKLQDLGES